MGRIIGTLGDTLRELGLPTHAQLTEYNDRSRNLAACPLCASAQIQFCGDFNNPSKDVCRCRECKCQAPRVAWQDRRA